MKRSTVNAVIGILFLGGVVAAGGPRLVRHFALEKYEASKALLRNAASGVESKFVDDCGGLWPYPDNAIPPELTTPIAYLPPRERIDPYSSSGEPLFYFNQHRRANGTLYLLASRGPDGDADVARLPREMSYSIPEFRQDIAEYKLNEVEEAYKGNPYSWLVNTEYYVTKSGERHETRKFSAAVLPLKAREEGWLTQVQLQEFLAQNGIAIYDPTNGLVSDGDVIRSNAR